MRHAIWMLGLSLALSGAAARANETGPIPQPEADAPMAELEAQARHRLLSPAHGERAFGGQPEVARLEADGTLSLRAKNISAGDLIQQVATLGRLQVLVDADAAGMVRLINIARKTPGQALEIIARACNLEIQQRGEVFLLRRLAPPQPGQRAEEPTFSLSFKESTAGDIVELLARQSDVPIEIEGALSHKKIGFMLLRDVSLKAALDNIALLLDAQATWKDGRYILSARLGERPE